MKLSLPFQILRMTIKYQYQDWRWLLAKKVSLSLIFQGMWFGGVYTQSLEELEQTCWIKCLASSKVHSRCIHDSPSAGFALHLFTHWRWLILEELGCRSNCNKHVGHYLTSTRHTFQNKYFFQPVSNIFSLYWVKLPIDIVSSNCPWNLSILLFISIS